MEHSYTWAIEHAEHLKAIGHETVFIDEADARWGNASRVEPGGLWRLNVPVSVWIVAEENDLTLKWSVDLETRAAARRGQSLFDRDRLRQVMRRLPVGARESFAAILREKVLPAIQANTQEIRDALNRQSDSEDCVRGLIAYAEAAPEHERAGSA